jgi:hypothetical protein
MLRAANKREFLRAMPCCRYAVLVALRMDVRMLFEHNVIGCPTLHTACSPLWDRESRLGFGWVMRQACDPVCREQLRWAVVHPFLYHILPSPLLQQLLLAGVYAPFANWA